MCGWHLLIDPTAVSVEKFIDQRHDSRGILEETYQKEDLETITGYVPLHAAR